MTALEKLAKDFCREFWDARYPNNKTIAKKEFEYRRKEWMALADHVTNSKIDTRIAELERQLKENK